MILYTVGLWCAVIVFHQIFIERDIDLHRGFTKFGSGHHGRVSIRKTDGCPLPVQRMDRGFILGKLIQIESVKWVSRSGCQPADRVGYNQRPAWAFHPEQQQVLAESARR